MAHVMKVDEEVQFYYFNATPVGSGADNKNLADVQLVRFFLREFFLHHPDLFKLVPKLTKDTGTIAIDGKVGGQTIKAIEMFQRHYPRFLILDGRVSVAVSKYVPETNNEKGFTIVALNQWFFGRNGNARWNGRLRQHPLIRSAPILLHQITYGEVNANIG